MAIGGYPSAAQMAGLDHVDPVAIDAEGRCLILEFPAFVLFGVYSPANSNGLRDNFRLGFLSMLDTRIRNLANMGKNVILTGDLNVSRDLIDTAKAEENMRSEGMTHEEYLSTPNRRIFNQLLCNGKVPGNRDEGREEPILYDLCREFHPDREGMYTHWEQKINARPGNFGSRIDFILCSIAIKDWFKESNIQEGLMGSDHCPVYAVTKEKVRIACNGEPAAQSEHDNETHVLDLVNPPGMFRDGVRQREYDGAKDVPALSGKLLTEFTKRRSIRDMFSKNLALPRPESTPICTLVEAKTESDGDGATPLAATTKEVYKEIGTLVEVSPFKTSTTGNGSIVPIASPLNSPEKRRASASAPPSKPIKRSKSNLSTAASSAGKGQQSLKGFFQSRSKPTDLSPTKERVPRLLPSPIADPSSQSTGSIPSYSPPARPSVSMEAYDPDPRASQEASRESWTKLFSKKPTPRCEHAEPCIILTTKKPGVNCGRQFYMCPRPIGPSGQKETGTQWRCGTFIWSSDWKGS